jgi:hypothetical protein
MARGCKRPPRRPRRCQFNPRPNTSSAVALKLGGSEVRQRFRIAFNGVLTISASIRGAVHPGIESPKANSATVRFEIGRSRQTASTKRG